MRRYFLRKGLSFFLSLFLLVSLTFLFMKLIPGDPFSQEQALPEEILNQLKDHYGLNDPWYVQYLHYLKSILLWDLGPSMKYRALSVNQIISESFPVSALLGLEVFLFSVSCGVFIGVLSSQKSRGWQERFILFATTLGISVPSFLLATVLQHHFAFQLAWFPIAQWGSFSHTILPALSLSVLPIAFISRLLKKSLSETLREDYIKTTRAKGFSQTYIIVFHALKNALLPLLPYLGQLMANLLVGSFVIEKIFGIPGLGQWFIQSVLNRDYPLMMGITVFYGSILLLIMFLIDLLIGCIDPRIRRVQ